MHKDGEPYRPANRTDADDFERAWCAHCLGCGGAEEIENELGEVFEVKCVLLEMALCDIQPPEWQYRGNRPICTAFTEDPDNPARCLGTLEMFSASGKVVVWEVT